MIAQPLTPVDEEAVVRAVHGPGGIGISPAFNWPEAALRPEARFQPGWGVWEGPRLAAFLFWRENGGEFEISVLATHPEFRRRGAMRLLLQRVIDAHSQKIWRLEVHEDNAAAIALYRQLGFQKIARRARYYRDGGAALLMERAPGAREPG
ncbi:MAG: GNAT family N-acetyltransferase [Bdellovibrionaceae bacterium]|nr:GNAT family N-acetyltransferase [Pseudobdellovibrionaceae bacterium]MBX3033435.1 GNAT family N-acetyltransferase [Pseudobdellovibrionaceae bacterium]